MVNDSGCADVLRFTLTDTSVPSGPRSSLNMSLLLLPVPATLMLSTSMMRSPACMPARSAAPPDITSTT